jgi:hypothetical protein
MCSKKTNYKKERILLFASITFWQVNDVIWKVKSWRITNGGSFGNVLLACAPEINNTKKITRVVQESDLENPLAQLEYATSSNPAPSISY